MLNKYNLAQKIKTVLPTLNERQRRIYLASESKALGWGGISTVARLSHISRTTIHTGLKELKEKWNKKCFRIRKEGYSAHLN